MAVYQCMLCGHTYNEETERVPFADLPDDWCCPACGAPKNLFEKCEDAPSAAPPEDSSDNPLAYPAAFFKSSSDAEPCMAQIHEMAVSGASITEPMGTRLPSVSWNDILFLGAQLNPAPLDAHADVNLKTVIGKHAKQPLELALPLYISHMSFGALSKELKIALAKGSAAAKTAMCSGEGGILPEERAASYRYIFEYVPNQYSVTDENLRQCDAIEIKIGQGTKPGMGGHLPGNKVTEEIAHIRNKPMGQDILSPSKFSSLHTKEDLKMMVDDLRRRSCGRPIGIKIAAGHIEQDLAWVAYAKPDFITLDGRGGATGASPKSLKDASSVPTIFALYRARKYMQEHQLEMDLVITGGLRVPADFVKALALGADAVAIASSALMAAACQQYRICHTGNCPVGVATQDPELRKRLHIEHSAARLANFLQATAEELAMFARVSGHDDIHSLSVHDLCTANRDIYDFTDIPHA